MFNLIEYIKQLFSKPKPQSQKHDSDIVVGVDKVCLITLFIDTESNNIGLTMNVDVDYLMSRSDWVEQANKLAGGLADICENNPIMTKMVLENIDVLKKHSDNHLLFFDNIIFFWDFHLAHIYNDSNEPIIRPSKAFKNTT